MYGIFIYIYPLRSTKSNIKSREIYNTWIISVYIYIQVGIVHHDWCMEVVYTVEGLFLVHDLTIATISLAHPQCFAKLPQISTHICGYASHFRLFLFRWYQRFLKATSRRIEGNWRHETSRNVIFFFRKNEVPYNLCFFKTCQLKTYDRSPRFMNCH